MSSISQKACNGNKVFEDHRILDNKMEGEGILSLRRKDPML